MKRKWYHFPLMGLTFVLGWVYVLTFLQICNLIANLIWFCRMLRAGQFRQTISEMNAVAAGLKIESDVVTEYTKFKYAYDGLGDFNSIFGKWPTWVPWICVFFYKQKINNCDGAEVYARWLFKNLRKNNPDYYKNLICKKVIYVPYIPSHLDKVHYFNVIGRTDGVTVTWHECFSSGHITGETKDELAIRYRHGDERYIWLQW